MQTFGAGKWPSLQDLLEIVLESMMLSERRGYLRENTASGNKCNGFRPGHSYGHGCTLTFRIPRDRYGNFHPRILAILRHQEDEWNALREPFTRKVLRRNRSARYSRISMASTTARRVFRGCWTTFVKMFRNGSHALWRRIIRSSSSIAYT